MYCRLGDVNYKKLVVHKKCRKMYYMSDEEYVNSKKRQKSKMQKRSIRTSKGDPNKQKG